MKEYYSRLFLKEGASIEDVKKAHRKLIKKFHPDKNDGTNEYSEEFKQIQDAYEKVVEHLKNGQTSYYSENHSEQKTSNQYKDGSIVKSDAMFAEAGETIEDDTYSKVIIMTLIGAFIFCSIYAILSLSHIL